jgi:anti-anti-sigma factor
MTMDLPEDPIQNEPPSCEFGHEHRPGSEIAWVAGEIDLATAAAFAQAVDEAERRAGHGHVVVDLGRCTYLDSSGLRVLSIAHQRLGARLRIVLPIGGSVHRIFEITGLTREFHVFPSLEGALQANPAQPAR